MRANKAGVVYSTIRGAPIASYEGVVVTAQSCNISGFTVVADVSRFPGVGSDGEATGANCCEEASTSPIGAGIPGAGPAIAFAFAFDFLLDLVLRRNFRRSRRVFCLARARLPLATFSLRAACLASSSFRNSDLLMLSRSSPISEKNVRIVDANLL